MRHGSVVSNSKVFGWVAAVALLALGLALLAAPAFGQAVAIDDSDSVEYNAVCQNIIGSIGGITQGQFGDADAIANAPASAGEETTSGASAETSAEAVAEIAQEQGVSIAQVNECLNGAAETPGGDTTNGGGTTNGGTTTGDLTPGEGTVSADVIVGTIPDQKVLADTGGPAVLLPALGLLLVTSGAAMLKALLRR